MTKPRDFGLVGCSPKELRKVQHIWNLFPNMHEVLSPGMSGKVEIRQFEVCKARAALNRLTRNELWLPGIHMQLDIDGCGWMFDSLHELSLIHI